MQPEFKRASWLELFYDVAFIALVAQLTYLATEHHHTLSDFLNIGIIAYTIFIAWWATTANRNLQPKETAADKLFIQLQMVGVFLMSISMAAVFAGNYVPFFLTLGLVRFLQSFMMVRMYYLHPETRPLTYNLLEGFVVAGALWVVSAFMPDPYHFVLAFAALAVDILVPITKGKGNTKRYLNVYHLRERLGLFLMLVIGESMIVVALSSSVTELSRNQFIIVFSGLGIMTALWWLYFEHSDAYADSRPSNLFSFLHAHGLLFGSIILLSAGYKLLLEGADEFISLGFVLAGSLGMAATLLVIRAMQHSICLRSLVMVALFALAAIAVTVGALVYGYTYTAVVAISLLFAIAAIADYFKAFSPTDQR